MSLTSKTGFIAGVSVLALSGVSFAGGPAEANDYSSFLQDAGGVSWSALVQLGYEDDDAEISFGKIQGTVSGSAGGWDFVVQDEFSASDTHDIEELSASTSFSGVGFKIGQFRQNWSRTAGMGDGGHFNTGGAGHDAAFDANSGYGEGFELSYAGDAWRVTGSWGDVDGSDDWNNVYRGEFLASGTWGQFDDFGAATGGEQGIMIGYSMDDESDDTVLDVSYEADGFGVMYQVHSDDAGDNDTTFWQGSYNMSADTTLWVQMETDDDDTVDTTNFGVAHQYGAGALITVQHSDDGTDTSIGAQLQLSF